MDISKIRQGHMDLSDSDMGPKKIETWDMDISHIRQKTRGISNNIDI